MKRGMPCFSVPILQWRRPAAPGPLDYRKRGLRLGHSRIQPERRTELRFRQIELAALSEEYAEHEVIVRPIGVVALARDELRGRGIERAPLIGALQ